MDGHRDILWMNLDRFRKTSIQYIHILEIGIGQGRSPVWVCNQAMSRCTVFSARFFPPVFKGESSKHSAAFRLDHGIELATSEGPFFGDP